MDTRRRSPSGADVTTSCPTHDRTDDGTALVVDEGGDPPCWAHLFPPDDETEAGPQGAVVRPPSW